MTPKHCLHFSICACHPCAETGTNCLPPLKINRNQCEEDPYKRKYIEISKSPRGGKQQISRGAPHDAKKCLHLSICACHPCGEMNTNCLPPLKINRKQCEEDPNKRKKARSKNRAMGGKQQIPQWAPHDAKNVYTFRFVRVILAQGHAHLLRIILISTNDPRREST